MPIDSEIKQLHDELRQWRHHLHQFPETAFQEYATTDYIGNLLQHFGLDVDRQLTETGVVASLTVGDGNKKIALRADIDALFIQEENTLPYRSRNDGKMHACGHDGHTAMLLGAAKYLTASKNFSGTVHFIFQPAEEGRAGAKHMLDAGLFEKYPTDYIFGMHNFPDIPAGQFAVKPGAMMAAFDCFEIRLSGQATHAAIPHLGRDPIVAAAQIINALQTIVSRNTDPLDSAVVSITQIHGGDTWNAIPESVLIRGTFRCFRPSVQKAIQHRLDRLTRSIGEAFGITVELVFNPENPGYPVTVNDANAAAVATEVATQLVGSSNVNRQPAPSMGSEDFAFMLQQKPGCYVWIGNGPSEGSCLLHNPHYDFNDDILPTGTAYWIKLVETILAT